MGFSSPHPPHTHSLANKFKYKENQREIQEVSRQLRESTKNLCRNLKDNPNISGNLLKIQHEVSVVIELSSSCDWLVMDL